MVSAIGRLALLAAALATGCAMLPGADAPIDERPETAAQSKERRARAAKPTYNLAGYPPAVREGYIDGCESAKGTRQGRKDVRRFAEDAQYAMGWNDGYSICAKDR